ncbi:MAG: hypothetical protein WCF84_26330 [Anaerolineae bacterium]
MVPSANWLQPNTEHGLLVAFGEFFQQHGLLPQLLHVPLPQKTRDLLPQAKLVEFLAGIMSGIEYLSDLNDGPRPLATDQTVARAWGQDHWAHYSSVSRTLSACDAQTVQAVQQAIETFSRPFIRSAVQEVLRTGRTLRFDLDLMGQPVSSTSTTYPLAAFGWMDDQIRLGYQSARICLTDASGTRLWLQGFHPGDTVSTACLQELVRAAEAQTGVRPRRRTDLVQQRLAQQQVECARPQRLWDQQQAKQLKLQQTQLHLQVQLAQAEQALKKPISPAKTARVLQQIEKWQARLPRLAHQLAASAQVLARHQATLVQLAAEQTVLQQSLQQLQADNQTNPDPPTCRVRMDSGFGSGANLTWLIEMGYEVDTKAIGDKTTQALRTQVSATTTWTRVGDNAEMSTWPDYPLHACPYPLTVGLERFKLGTQYAYATLLRYRPTAHPVDLTAWFMEYNGRQLIEAGNKELKGGVFHVQHLMSRSLPGIQIQVLFAGLAANSVRWCMPWLRTCVAEPNAKLTQTLSSPKHMVRVAANATALVQQTAQGTALQFAPTSALPGVTLFLKGVPAFQLPLGLQEPFKIASQTTIRPLVAQNLR